MVHTPFAVDNGNPFSWAMWLEELASESNTIQAQEDITQPGKIAGQYPVKLYMFLWWFSINISGSVSSFGLSSCVARDIISLHQWIAAGPSRKSIWERFRWDNVCQHDGSVADFMIRGRLTRKIGRSGAQGSALTRNVARSHGSKNLLQRAILYRHKKIYHRQGWRQAKTQWN